MKTSRRALAFGAAWAVLSLLAAGCWDSTIIVPDTSPDAGGDTDTDTVEIDCYEGDYEIEDAADVAFLAPYPCVTGDLIVSTIEITSLDLPSLEWIGGDLGIGGYDWDGGALASLGLDNLASVGGSFWLGPTALLTSLDGLESLTFVGGLLSIQAQGALTEISALAGLEHVGSDLYVDDNTSLASLDGLEGLESIVGDVFIVNNEVLESLDGLESLVAVGGSFEVSNNPSLPTCEVCELLAQIADGPAEDDLDVHGNLDDACLEGTDVLVCP